MQILRQCEDLVKLKIRKDEDNSGMPPSPTAAKSLGPPTGPAGSSLQFGAPSGRGGRVSGCWWRLVE